jgi:hypothetical protein
MMELAKVAECAEEVMGKTMNALTDTEFIHGVMIAEKKFDQTSKKVKKEFNSFKAEVKKYRGAK